MKGERLVHADVLLLPVLAITVVKADNIKLHCADASSKIMIQSQEE